MLNDYNGFPFPSFPRALWRHRDAFAGHHSVLSNPHPQKLSLFAGRKSAGQNGRQQQPIRLSCNPTLTFVAEGAPLFQAAASSTAGNDCAIFSCSTHGYSLVKYRWKASNTTPCDRYHLYGTPTVIRPTSANSTNTTTTTKTSTVPPHWCRVSLLEDSYTFEGMYTNTTRSPLTAYSTLIYVDVDVVFDEAALLGVAQSKLSSSSSNKNDTTLWHISSKVEGAHTILRTCSFVLPNRQQARPMVRNWARHWRDITHLPRSNCL